MREVVGALLLERERLLLEVDANVFGTVASRVFTTRPTFSSATGAPYRRLTAVPYENASSAYFGNCLRVAFFGDERQHETVGSELPGPVVRADDDVRSVAGATVLSWSRMSPKSFSTTSTFTPRRAAQAFAIRSMSARRSLSVQIGACRLCR